MTKQSRSSESSRAPPPPPPQAAKKGRGGGGGGGGGPSVTVSETGGREAPATAVRRLAREKSFDEARTAVQSQIEKIFKKAAEQQRQHQPSAKHQLHHQHHVQHHLPPGGSRKGLLGGIQIAGSDLPAETVAPASLPVPALLSKKGGEGIVGSAADLSLQALADKDAKRRGSKHHARASRAESDSSALVLTASSSSSSLLRQQNDSKKGREATRPKPFRIHAQVHEQHRGRSESPATSATGSNMQQQHASMDNLVAESNSLYARRIQQQQQYVGHRQQQQQQHKQQHRYTSLMNLSVYEHPSRSHSGGGGGKSKRSASQEEDTTEQEGANSSRTQSMSSGNKYAIKPSKKKAPAPKKPHPQQTNLEQQPKQKQNARDSGLVRHLGRMSPEEQVDKFLQSVEEVNAENDIRGAVKVRRSGGGGGTAKEAPEGGRDRMFSKNKKMRGGGVGIGIGVGIGVADGGGGGNQRWRSMDNLTYTAAAESKEVADSPTKKKSSLHHQLPPFNKPSLRQKQKKISSSSATVGFSGREINGPKSFASLSELDRLGLSGGQRESSSMEFEGEGGKGAAGRKRKQRGVAGGKSSEEERKLSMSSMDLSRPEQQHHQNKHHHNHGSSKQQQQQQQQQIPPSPISTSSTSSVRTNVIYLGRVALSSGASNLASLQLPLKDLYLDFIRLSKSGRSPPPSSLEIGEEGLRVSYAEERLRGVQEIFNPFPTIAVWAAVRFIYRREAVSSEHGEGADGGGGNRNRFLFAFLPLISDPGDAEKDQLFNPLPKSDIKLAASFEHPAVFACIMRRGSGGGEEQSLECHGFVCESKEDAILIASNLYKSLMETMKKQQEDNKEEESRPSLPPQRPPRQRKAKKQRGQQQQQRSSEDSSSLATASSQQAEENFARANSNDNDLGKVKRSHSEKFLDEIPSRSRNRARRSISERRSFDDSDVPTLRRAKERRAGDIYTKVAMPRSKSFMNVSGPYNLQELFRELKEKEGIESVDDILRQVVSADGMSFNGTSPVYRELLMKLAMSMSADEMFIRSKNIIMQEKLKKVSSPMFGGGGGVALAAAAKSNDGGLGNGFAARVLQKLGVARRNKGLSPGKVTKADIGEPLPLPEETKRELTKQWMRTSPHLSEVVDLTKGKQQQHASNNSNNNVEFERKKSGVGVAAAVASSKRRSMAAAAEGGGESSVYMSCSECGYQSVCGTNCCSCSMFATTTAAEEEDEEDEEDDDDHGSDRRGNKKSSSSSAYSAMSISQSPSDTTTTVQGPGKKRSSYASSSGASQGTRHTGSSGRTNGTVNNNKHHHHHHHDSSSSESSASSCSTCLQRSKHNPPTKQANTAPTRNTAHNHHHHHSQVTCHFCGDATEATHTANDTATCYSCSMCSESNASDAGAEARRNNMQNSGHPHRPVARKASSKKPPPTKSIDDSGANSTDSASSSSSDGGSASFDNLSGAQSPQTAWRWNSSRNGQQQQQRKQQQQQHMAGSTSDSEEESESESEEESSSDNTSIVSAYRPTPPQKQKAAAPSVGNSSNKSNSSGTGGAEHVDGFFRNLSLVSGSGGSSGGGGGGGGDGGVGSIGSAESRNVSFQNVNSSVASRQLQVQQQQQQQGSSSSRHKKGRKAVEAPPPPPPVAQQQQQDEDSLSASSSDSSASSEDTLTGGGGRKLPRQAYSEANMHNSLGYLP